MAEDGDYDPNAGVPTWVNVVVPLAMVGLFVLVLAWITYTGKEIPVETLDRWADRLGITKLQEVIGDKLRRDSEMKSRTSNHNNGGRGNDRADGRRNLAHPSRHVKTSVSVISDFTVSSFKSGYSNPDFYVFESNV